MVAEISNPSHGVGMELGNYITINYYKKFIFFVYF